MFEHCSNLFTQKCNFPSKYAILSENSLFMIYLLLSQHFEVTIFALFGPKKQSISRMNAQLLVYLHESSVLYESTFPPSNLKLGTSRRRLQTWPNFRWLSGLWASLQILPESRNVRHWKKYFNKTTFETLVPAHKMGKHYQTNVLTNKTWYLVRYSMFVSKYDVKWLKVELWILKDFWPICGWALWRRNDWVQSGDFRADQDSGSQGARSSTQPWNTNINQDLDIRN